MRLIEWLACAWWICWRVWCLRFMPRSTDGTESVISRYQFKRNDCRQHLASGQISGTHCWVRSNANGVIIEMNVLSTYIRSHSTLRADTRHLHIPIANYLCSKISFSFSCTLRPAPMLEWLLKCVEGARTHTPPHIALLPVYPARKIHTCWISAGLFIMFVHILWHPYSSILFALSVWFIVRYSNIFRTYSRIGHRLWDIYVIRFDSIEVKRQTQKRWLETAITRQARTHTGVCVYVPRAGCSIEWCCEKLPLDRQIQYSVQDCTRCLSV